MALRARNVSGAFEKRAPGSVTSPDLNHRKGTQLSYPPAYPLLPNLPSSGLNPSLLSFQRQVEKV